MNWNTIKPKHIRFTVDTQSMCSGVKKGLHGVACKAGLATIKLGVAIHQYADRKLSTVCDCSDCKAAEAFVDELYETHGIATM